MCRKSFCAHMGCTARTDSHGVRIGSEGSIFGIARGGDGAGGGCCDFCAGGDNEVSLVMILVGTLLATGAKFMPVATLESPWLSLVCFDQECPSL